MRLPLVVILVIALGGACLSGYLTYRALLGAMAGSTCAPVGGSGPMFGAPPCVYGFGLYLTIVVVAVIALGTRRRPPAR